MADTGLDYLDDPEEPKRGLSDVERASRGIMKADGDDVRAQMLKADILHLKHQGKSAAEIGAIVGLSRTAIVRMIPKIMREVLDEAGAEEVRGMELIRLEMITQSMWPALVKPEDPDFIPDDRMVNAYLNVSKRKAELVGADAPKQLKVDVNDNSAIAEQLVTNVNRYMDLADRVAAGGIGSGRTAEELAADGETIDAEVVEDLPVITGITTARKAMEGAITDPIPADAPRSPLQIGTWEKGKFVEFERPDDNGEGSDNTSAEE